MQEHPVEQEAGPYSQDEGKATGSRTGLRMAAKGAVRPRRLAWPANEKTRWNYFNTWQVLAAQALEHYKKNHRILAPCRMLFRFDRGYLAATNLQMSEVAGGCSIKTISRDLTFLKEAGLLDVLESAKRIEGHTVKTRRCFISVPEPFSPFMSLPDDSAITFASEQDNCGPDHSRSEQDNCGPDGQDNCGPDLSTPQLKKAGALEARSTTRPVSPEQSAPEKGEKTAAEKAARIRAACTPGAIIKNKKGTRFKVFEIFSDRDEEWLGVVISPADAADAKTDRVWVSLENGKFKEDGKPCLKRMGNREATARPF